MMKPAKGFRASVRLPVLGTAWLAKLRDSRRVGDLRRRKEPDAYRKALDHLLRALQVEKA